MSRIPTSAEKTILRTTPFRSKTYMVVEKGTQAFIARVNDPAILPGATVIAYDGDSGESAVLPGMTLFNKSLDEVGNEKGSARIKSINTTTNQITIEPNSIDWKDNDDLLVDAVFRLYRILPDIISGVVKEDFDKAYTNQNDRDKRKPVALMGCDRYAWRGEPIAFYGWRSFAKAYNVAGERCGIAGYNWDFDGGTIMAGGTTAPGTPSSPNSVKWNTSGERHVSLEVTDDNQNKHKAYRPVIVVDRPAQGANPPYEEFEIENLEGDWESGEWKASIRVMGDATPSEFPNNARVIIYSEDWYGDTKLSIGGWYGQEDILLCANIIEDSVRQDAETGEVTFEIASITNQLKELDMWPLNFKNVAGTPAAWHEFKNMTVEDIFWHIVEEHTTLKNIADLFIWTGVSGGKRVDFFDASEASIYDQLDQQLLSAIFGHLVSGRYSSVHGNRNFNMLNMYQRLQVGRVMMNLEKQDWIDDLEIAGERHRDAVCQVDFIGFIYNPSGDPIEVYSLAPENQKNFGQVEKVTGILLSGSTIAAAQPEANELSGLYLAYQNIRFPSLTAKLRNYRIFDPAHQDLVGLAIQPSDTQRGYDWYDPETGRAKEFIVRRVSYEIDHEGGYMTATLGLEASTWGKDGTSGDYPPIPPPDEPDEPPPYPPPPAPSQGKKVIAATLSNGIIRADDIFATPPVWQQINSGLVGNALKTNGFIRDPWDPSNTGIIFTEDGIYRSTNLRAAVPTWTQVLSNAQADALCGISGGYIQDLNASICQEGLFFAIYGRSAPVVARYCIRSIDGGITWGYRGQLVGTCLYWPSSVYLDRANCVGYEAKSGNLYLSYHDANKLWAFCVTCAGAVHARSTIFYSGNQGTSWTVLKEATSGLTKLPAGQVPYYNNPNDQRMYVVSWGTLGEERKSLDGGTTLSVINPPTAVRFNRCLEEHTWNQNLVVAVGEIGAQDSNGELTISQDGGSSWGAGIDLGMPVWTLSGFPYNEQLMYFGRAKAPVLRDYPFDPTAPLIKITQDGGATLLDKSGNLRADFNVKSIVSIIPDWLE
jgi:hypothetical protein